MLREQYNQFIKELSFIGNSIIETRSAIVKVKNKLAICEKKGWYGSQINMWNLTG